MVRRLHGDYRRLLDAPLSVANHCCNMVSRIMSYIRTAWNVFTFGMILAAFGIFALIVGMTVVSAFIDVVAWFLL